MKDDKRVCVVGWINPYTTNKEFVQVPFDASRRRALVARIKKRAYYFTYDFLQFMDCTPLYSDYAYCVPTKQELDSVFEEALADCKNIVRKSPLDEEECIRYDDIIFEKEKFVDAFKEYYNE